MSVEPSVDAPVRRFLRPADYYSSATPQPVLPRWASYGCGAASLLVLIVVFAGGAFLSTGGFTQFMDLVFGMTLGEMRGMYDPAVSDAQKKALEQEIETLRANLRTEKVSVGSLDPVLQAMRRASSDEKLHAAEVTEIVSAARKVNATARR